MLKDVIYFSSYFFAAAILRFFWTHRYRFQDGVFLLGVTLIPLGRLFYLPGGGFASITAALIFGIVTGGTGLLLKFIKGVDRFVFIPLVVAFIALCSHLFLTGLGQNAYFFTGPQGSTFLRILSVFAITVYSSYVIVCVSEKDDAELRVARYYVFGTLFATFLGFLIFYGAFTRMLTADDILPVSVQEVHLIGRIYRFNPGANVNEFGQVAGYALLLLRWTGWGRFTKICAAAALLTAEVLSFTRGAWLALVVAYVVMFLLSKNKYKFQLLMTAIIAVYVVVWLLLSSDSLGYLVASRLNFDAGAGGDDRLHTMAVLMEGLMNSPFRLLFGFGWASNGAYFGDEATVNDPHDVPFMVLYYTGLVGVVAYTSFFLLLARYISASVKKDLDLIAALIAFMFTVSLFEHNFYHIQTWLFVGLVLGIALRSTRGKGVGESAQTDFKLRSAGSAS